MVIHLCKYIKNIFLTFFFFLLTVLLLTFPGKSLAFSLTGLQLWFNKMIPALLPFMILSGIMIRLNLTENFVKIVSPVLTPLLRISLNGIYAVLIGFLCGFPMGARVIAELYGADKISKNEASLLLGFCNNIGPVYFISFVLPTLGLTRKFPLLFGMYGLPFLYGIFLRYTFYRDKIPMYQSHSHPPSPKKNTAASQPSLLSALDDSIMSGLYGIARLGGYMILFNLLNVLYFPGTSAGKDTEAAFLNCLLEITSGISRLGDQAPLMVLLLLPFGGFSCIAQTYSMIKTTDLSLSKYVLHKLVLTLITACYYGLWLLLSPSSFLL